MLMADKLVKTRVQMKRGTSAEWALATGFKPLEGEIIFYSDLNKIKVGKKDTDGNLMSLEALTFLDARDADTLDGKHASEFALKSDIPTVPTSFAPIDAEKNVQSDWAETNTSSDAFIKNKPTIPVDTNTTYDLAAPVSKTNGNVTIDLTAGGSGSGTDSVKIKGSGATTVTTDANGVIIVNSTDNDTKVTSAANHYDPTADSSKALSADAKDSTTSASWGTTQLVTGVNLQRDAKGHVTGVTVDSIKMPTNPDTNDNQTIKAKGVSFEANDAVELKEGSNVTITANKTARTITISATDTTYTALKNPNALGFLNSSGTEVDDYDGSSNVKLKAGSNVEMTAADGTVTITAKDTTYSEVAANGTAGLMSGADKAELDSIAAGAEVNVQSDWNQIDSTKDDFIKNKPTALKNPNALSIGGKSYDGSSVVNVTAAELRTHLGLNNALHFIGLTTTTTIADNSTTTTITVDGKSHTAVAGDVVLYNDNEYVFDGSKWLELGDGSSHALKTNTVTAGKGLTDGGQIGSNPTLNVGQGNGITVTADAVAAKAGNGITVDSNGINHADTSSQASVTASGRKYITGVTLDTYGHVTGLTTGTETVTDTNQKIKAGNVTFGVNDEVNLVAGQNTTVTGNASNKTVTIGVDFSTLISSGTSDPSASTASQYYFKYN
jgi:hypothetical protein